MSLQRDLDFELLYARSIIPELGPFYLPDHWRADKRIPSCSTCGWDGYWNSILTWGRSSRGPLKAINLKQSAAAGNFCCAVLFALSRKLCPLVGGGSGDVELKPFYKELYIGGKPSWVQAVYVTGNSDETRAPPGVELNPFEVPHPESDESLAWAQSHIQNCVLGHSCHTFKSHDQHLPTRLVHIPQDFEALGVRLIANAPEKLPEGSRYAALTHCWGEKKPECLTTGENFDLHSTRGIPWANVPRLFKDAMRYSRRLGLEYMWIDSLCIIQQDKRDWDKESPRMFSYYSNAYITLGSTFSRNCYHRLFGQRREWRLYLFDMIFKGLKLPVYACRFPGFGRDYVTEQETMLGDYETDTCKDFVGSPYNLFTRSWTYQERLVSPRLLLFTHKQVVFECYAGRYLQQGPDDTNIMHLKRSYRELLTNHSSDSWYGSWQQIVSSFSILQLSSPTDKLPAFSAIAQQCLSHTPLPYAAEDEYLCGLRKSYLHCDLVWTTHFHHNYTPVDCYLAPSWSWASIPGATSCGRLGMHGKYSEGSTITLLSDEGLQFTDAGRFGRVQKGSYIVVQGPVLDCTLSEWQVGSDFDGGQQLRLTNGWKDSRFRFYPDYSHGHKGFDVDEVPLCLLQTWVIEHGLGFLVLHKNNETGRHYRVGVCQFHRYPYHLDEDGFLSALEEQFQVATQRVLEIE